MLQYIVDMERFAGLNIHGFNPIEVFMEILPCCLGQKCLLYNIIKERCLYSRKNFDNTLENCEGLAQRIFPHLQQQLYNYSVVNPQILTCKMQILLRENLKNLLHQISRYTVCMYMYLVSTQVLKTLTCLLICMYACVNSSTQQNINYVQYYMHINQSRLVLEFH